MCYRDSFRPEEASILHWLGRLGVNVFTSIPNLTIFSSYQAV